MHTPEEHNLAKAHGFTCETARNQCCCLRKGEFMIARQLGSDPPIYNAYVNVYKTRKTAKGKMITIFAGQASVIKEVIKTMTYLDEDEEEYTEDTIGPKMYTSLADAIADCK